MKVQLWAFIHICETNQSNLLTASWSFNWQNYFFKLVILTTEVLAWMKVFVSGDSCDSYRSSAHDVRSACTTRPSYHTFGWRTLRVSPNQKKSFSCCFCNRFTGIFTISLHWFASLLKTVLPPIKILQERTKKCYKDSFILFTQTEFDHLIFD